MVKINGTKTLPHPTSADSNKLNAQHSFYPCCAFYSGLTLNQYGKARQRRTGLKLIHYIIVPTHRERDKSTNLHFQIQASCRCLYCFDIIQPKNRKQVTIITGWYVTQHQTIPLQCLLYIRKQFFTISLFGIFLFPFIPT